MDKINKTTMVGLLVLSITIAVGLTVWILGGKSAQEGPNLGQSTQQDLKPANGANSGQTPEIAPIYEGEESQPFIQISKETKSTDQSSNLEIPSGFGLENNVDNPSEQPQQAKQNESLKELPVELETPLDPQNQPTVSDSNIEAIDPREVGVTANDGPDQNFEETVLTVQRTLTAVNPEGEKQLIRLKIPVMYKSRTLRLEGTSKQKAVELLSRLKKKSEELAQIKADLETALVDWNQLVKSSTPYEVLLPESPTLPQNQSAGNLNRENDPSMSAGKSISYEIINN